MYLLISNKMLHTIKNFKWKIVSYIGQGTDLDFVMLEADAI